MILRGLNTTAIGHSKATYGVQPIINRAMDVWKAKCIRLPSGQTPDTTPAGLEALYQLYKEFIDYITLKGGYAIIDLHRIGNPLDTQAADIAFWQYIAARFKDYPNVLFEIYNEPTVSVQNNQITAPNFRNWQNSLINAVRGTGAKNIILFPGTHYCQLILETLTHPPTDPMPDSYGLAQVAHVYPGMWRRTNNDLFGEVDQVAKKYPIFITECGFDKDLNNNGQVYGSHYDPAQPTSQRWNYGKVLKVRTEVGGYNWNFWCLNRLQDAWVPVPCNNDWSPRQSPNYDGQFFMDWLHEKAGYNSPQAAPVRLPRPRVSKAKKRRL